METFFTTIDSLTEINPDSALQILKKIEPQISSSTQATRNRYLLLKIKALDKAMITHTSDTTILRLINYYEHNGDKKLLPITYYYAGRIYRDLNDAPQALEYFKKAANILEKTEPYSTLLEKTYFQAGYILSYQRIFEDCLEFREKAYKISLHNKDSLGILYSLRDIAETFWDLNKWDSAHYYYLQAETLAYKQMNKKMYANINGQTVLFYLQQGRTKEAEKALRKSETYTDSSDISSILSIHSRYYRYMGYTDSAHTCDIKLIKHGNIYGKRVAYANLTEYYLNRNNPEQAASYFIKYNECNDSVMKITASEAVAKMNATLNYKKREEENSRLKIQQKEDETKLAVLTIICIALTSATTLLILRKNLGDKIKKERLKRIKVEINQNTILKNENTVKNLPTYILLKNKIKENTPHLTPNEWEQIDIDVNKAFKGFAKKLDDLCKMSVHEYRVCLLVKMDISPTNIAKITNRSKEAIASTRRRLYQKAFGEKAAPAEWDKVIRSL